MKLHSEAAMQYTWINVNINARLAVWFMGLIFFFLLKKGTKEEGKTTPHKKMVPISILSKRNEFCSKLL